MSSGDRPTSFPGPANSGSGHVAAASFGPLSRTLFRRGLILAFVALLQVLIVVAGWTALLYTAASGSDRVWNVLFLDRAFMSLAAIQAGALCVLQFCFLLPVREPAPRVNAPASLWLSIFAAGAAGACLLAALILAALNVLALNGVLIAGEDPSNPLAIVSEGFFAMTLLASWAVATPLVYLFMRRGRVETKLSKLASALFLGSIVEAAAIIPIEVLVRKRESCYCSTGTFWGIILCIGVGGFAIGPAIVLVLLSRRRKRWWQGHCEVCDYDMSGAMHAAQCPECGAGWRRDRSQT